jgi:hypothetical protein
MKKLFYKYKSLDNEEDFKKLKCFLQQKVWMTPLTEFNDPFEGAFKLESLPPNVIKNNSELFALYFENFKRTQPNLTEEIFIKLLDDPSFNQELHKVDKQKLIRDFFAQNSALCLTSSCTNIPMWAYYANNHQGYCVVLDLDLKDLDQLLKKNDPNYLAKEHIKATLKGKEILSWTHKIPEYNIQFSLAKVNYGNKPPAIKLMEMYFPAEGQYGKVKHTVQNGIGFKFNQWKHEKEFRLISSLNSKTGGLMHLDHAPFLKITGIILGKNMCKERHDSVIALCNKYKIKTYLAHCHEYEYKISIKKLNAE